MCERINLSEIVDLMEEVVREEYDDTVDRFDAINETVDGSEWVIYYSKAAQVVEAADSDEQENAYAEAVDGAGRAGIASYGALQCLMAYAILRERLSARFTD